MPAPRISTEIGTSPLIATAYLEERLIEAIKARLVEDDELGNKLFKGYGPLGSLSAKIDMGFLLGIYEKDVRRFLHTVKDIRNAFAHKPEPMDFQTQKIKDLCSNIDISLKTELKFTAPDGTVDDVIFELRSDGKPKTAFFNMTKYVLLILDTEIKIVPRRGPAPPVLQTLAKPFLESSEES